MGVISLTSIITRPKKDHDMSKRYKSNPFLKNFEMRVSDINSIFITDQRDFIDPETGEIVNARMVKRTTVDREKFIKIFSDMVGHLLELSSAGTKVFGFLLWVLQNNKPGTDVVRLDNYELEVFSETYEFVISRTVLTRGIQALEDRRVIAKTDKMGYYWINPSMIFNGDRIALTHIITRKG